MTNETPQPNANIRQRTCAKMPVFIDFSGEVSALITAWLEVRVLPGPPSNKIKHLAGILAAVATVIGDSCLTVVTEADNARAMRRLGVNRRRNAMSELRPFIPQFQT